MVTSSTCDFKLRMTRVEDVDANQKAHKGKKECLSNFEPLRDFLKLK